MVNERGERILDTLVQPQYGLHEISVGKGLKETVVKFAEHRAEPLPKVIERIRRLVTGKKLIGYHLFTKLADLKLTDLFERACEQEEEKEWVMHDCYDVAKIFNDSVSGQ